MPDMHIMFVCTGNICRSPMAELLMARYLDGTPVRVSSAGTHGLQNHEMDLSSATLLQKVGIVPHAFRSRRLTAQIADTADLILCFQKEQRKDIVALAPRSVKHTFMLTEFADMCRYGQANALIEGDDVEERVGSVVNAAGMIRPMLPESVDIEDPHGKAFDVFIDVAEQTDSALRTIIDATRGENSQSYPLHARH